MNDKQEEALVKLFVRDPDGCATIAELRARCHPEIGYPDTFMIDWCGMFLGIEPDGYTHS